MANYFDLYYWDYYLRVVHEKKVVARTISNTEASYFPLATPPNDNSSMPHPTTAGGKLLKSGANDVHRFLKVVGE